MEYSTASQKELVKIMRLSINKLGAHSCKIQCTGDTQRKLKFHRSCSMSSDFCLSLFLGRTKNSVQNQIITHQNMFSLLKAILELSQSDAFYFSFFFSSFFTLSIIENIPCRHFTISANKKRYRRPKQSKYRSAGLVRLCRF